MRRTEDCRVALKLIGLAPFSGLPACRRQAKGVEVERITLMSVQEIVLALFAISNSARILAVTANHERYTPLT